MAAGLGLSFYCDWESTTKEAIDRSAHREEEGIERRGQNAPVNPCVVCSVSLAFIIHGVGDGLTRAFPCGSEASVPFPADFVAD